MIGEPDGQGTENIKKMVTWPTVPEISLDTKPEFTLIHIIINNKDSRRCVILHLVSLIDCYQSGEWISRNGTNVEGFVDFLDTKILFSNNNFQDLVKLISSVQNALYWIL